MTEKLKACPFCGGRAEIVSEYANAYYVECTNCWASIPQNEATPENAIAKWNKRVQPDPDNWVMEDEDELLWECPKCHIQFKLNSGNPEEHNMHYCLNCGARLTIAQD